MSAQVTLLCIDDEETGLKLRKLLFEREGHQVLTAADGTSGIDLFKTQPIDAVILDYRMPEMDGAAVAEKLKELRPRCTDHHALRREQRPERGKANRGRIHN